MQVTNGHVEPASALVEKTSATYIGQWNHLVSTTNWEKGRIIYEWRQALAEAGAPPQSYSDETWSQRVGNVSSQHVGRLRRVHERFASIREEYPRLYWSHFQAALDWPDAEDWLRQAFQRRWSIMQVRTGRAEALGLDADTGPGEQESVNREFDEDALSDNGDSASWDASWDVIRDPEERERGTSRDARYANEEDGGTTSDDAPNEPSYVDDTSAGEDREIASPPVRPFAHLKTLPSDLEAAYESMKLAILRHKLSGWKEISCDDLLASLEALKTLAVAPSAD